MDYSTANEKLGSRESRKLGNNTYLQRRGESAIAVKLHATDVLTFHADGRTVYNSGGWKTSTTKARMNDYGPLRIFTERGVWYTCRPGEWDKRLTYADGLTVGADGVVSGDGVAPDERGDKRAIKKFVAAYLEAFQRGEVPAPGPGDCWYCGMREVNTLRPLGEVQGDQAGHIRGHFAEPYYVPSLLSRAMEVFGASQVARQWVAAYWDINAPEAMAREVKESDYYARHGRETCAKMLRRYLSRQLGYDSWDTRPDTPVAPSRGWFPAHEGERAMENCTRCFGRGYLPESRKPSKRNPHGLGFYARTCPKCGGTGHTRETVTILRDRKAGV